MHRQGASGEPEPDEDTHRSQAVTAKLAVDRDEHPAEET